MVIIYCSDCFKNVLNSRWHIIAAASAQATPQRYRAWLFRWDNALLAAGMTFLDQRIKERALLKPQDLGRPQSGTHRLTAEGQQSAASRRSRVFNGKY